MSREQVIDMLGTPQNVSAQGSDEYLSYYLCVELCWAVDRSFRVREWNYVRLRDGVVESFGKTGDFDSTKTPTVRIETDTRIDSHIETKGSGDMYSELMKLKELKESGALTAEEFEIQKRKLLEKY